MSHRATERRRRPEPASPRAQVVVLVGPKGAGKSTVGRALERREDVRFLHVEIIAKRVLDNDPPMTPDEVDRAFAPILRDV